MGSNVWFQLFKRLLKNVFIFSNMKADKYDK